MTTEQLPPTFGSLEPFVAEWALETQRERYSKRSATSREELKRFYDAMLPQMEAILQELDNFPLGKLPVKQRRLYALALSLAEIAPNIELYGGNPQVPHSFAEERMLSGHDHHPTWQGRSPSP